MKSRFEEISDTAMTCAEAICKETQEREFTHAKRQSRSRITHFTVGIRRMRRARKMWTQIAEEQAQVEAIGRLAKNAHSIGAASSGNEEKSGYRSCSAG
jgi:hypothetical protein